MHDIVASSRLPAPSIPPVLGSVTPQSPPRQPLAKGFGTHVWEGWRSNMVPPNWLPQGWGRGGALFALSTGIQLAATGLTALMLQLLPDFSFRGALFIIGATLASHFFGGTLGLYASALGTLLLKFFFLPPTFSLLLDKLSDIWVSLFYFGVCLVVAYFARPRALATAH